MYLMCIGTVPMQKNNVIAFIMMRRVVGTILDVIWKTVGTLQC
jgi:hypothetical protein